MRKILFGGVLGAALVGIPAFTLLAAPDPQLQRDLTELRHAKEECGHIRQILRSTHDKYGMGGQWTEAEDALTTLMRHIDEAEGVVSKQIAQSNKAH